MSLNRLAAALLFASSTALAQSPATPAPAGGAGQTQPPAPPPELDIGKPAPDFTMEAADATGPLAKPVKLSDLRGKVVVLAFYPGDRTSGCTAELTKFRDEFATLFGEGTVVVGISNDNIASHASWAQEMKFPFALASDPDLTVAKQYGSWAPGRTSAMRTIFVIDRNGKIVYRNLKFPALNETAYTDLAAEVAKARNQ